MAALCAGEGAGSCADAVHGREEGRCYEAFLLLGLCTRVYEHRRATRNTGPWESTHRRSRLSPAASGARCARYRRPRRRARAALLLVLPLDVLLLLDHLAPRALLLKAVGRVPPVLRVVQRVGGLWHAREAARAEKRRPELVRKPTRNSAGKMIAPKSVTIGDVDTSSPHRGPLALPPCLRVSVVQNVRGTFVFVFP